jgi:hypothetical protein
VRTNCGQRVSDLSREKIDLRAYRRSMQENCAA